MQITIRKVPGTVRNELAARAALRRQSIQEYLLCELERIASRPTIGAWLGAVRNRKEASKVHIAAADILAAREADRRT